MKNSKFGKSWILYMYTLGPQCKIFNYGLQRELMDAKCLHSGRNKWNSVNHLWFHEKWCATKLFRSIFVNVWLIILTTWNFKMQAKLQFFRPPNSYILHCHGKCGLFTIYLKGNDMKNSKFGKSWILYMYTLGPQGKIFKLWLTEGTHGCQMSALY